tara:strand:+ start:92 stop:448 length:357 start_codon:yes stop_codon:yes gene_type:complete
MAEWQNGDIRLGPSGNNTDESKVDGSYDKCHFYIVITGTDQIENERPETKEWEVEFDVYKSSLTQKKKSGVIKTGDEWKCSFDLDWPPSKTTTKLTIKSQAGAVDEGVIVRFDYRGSH